MKVDIVFPASSRPEFTRASLEALKDNTDWSLVRALWLYWGDATDETRRIMARFCLDIPFEPVHFEIAPLGGPVATMNHWIDHSPDEAIMAKIDNDCIVPPGWLQAAAGVMERHPELDLLGLEPPLSRTPAPWASGKRIAEPEYGTNHVYARGFCGYAPCEAIGGIGLMRRRAFVSRERMVPHSTYGGFTDWQQRHPNVVKGWIVPPISLFLLDRLPMEPWVSLSKRYILKGQQRAWTRYTPEAAKLWEWWTKQC